MTEFLIYVFSICSLHMPQEKCERMYYECVDRLSAIEYYDADPTKSCTKIVGEVFLDKTIRKCK